jgi:hypothetical protein
MHSEDLAALAYVGNDTLGWEFTCARDDHPSPGPFSWAAPDEPVDLGQSLGLDLRWSLPKAVQEASDSFGGGWVEYGLVERAWALANPDDWRMLVEKYDHRYFYGETATRASLPYSASKYLAGRLGALSRLRDVSYRSGRGTGYWSYLSKVSYWAPVSREASETVVNFEAAAVSMSAHMPTL